MSLGADLANFVSVILENLGIRIQPHISEILAAIILLIIFFFLGWFVYQITERYLSRWAKKTKTKLDDEILLNIKKPIYFFVLLVGVYYALEFISIIQDYSYVLIALFTLAEILLAAFIITRVINVIIAWYAERRSKERMSEHFLFTLRTIIKGIVILFAFLFILHSWGIDLSGAVVGLGVSGIVIGFALQNVLADFFSAFSIYFDRPFEIGDFIVVGDYSGTVVKITMKSTRIKLLQGEELIISNKELTSKSVRNFKKMKKRRISFKFGVTYDTPLKKLEKIPQIINKIINSENIEYVDRLDRVHFIEFGDFSLNFEVVYYLKTKDYVKYRDAQQRINFDIKGAFEKEGIEMAFPTQTIYLDKTN